MLSKTVPIVSDFFNLPSSSIQVIASLVREHVYVWESGIRKSKLIKRSPACGECYVVTLRNVQFFAHGLGHLHESEPELKSIKVLALCPSALCRSQKGA